LHDVNFLPGGGIFGDLPGMLALAAPAPTWLAGEKATSIDLVTQAYKLGGNDKGLTIADAPADQREAAVVEYLLEAQK
jgi:hypothetical protein